MKLCEFTMTAQDIKLRNVIDDEEVFPSIFYHGDTILDLKKRFAEEQGYGDEYQHITFYGQCIELPDEKLVRDQANTKEGISYQISNCVTVVANENIFAIINSGQPNLLVHDEEEVCNLGHKRHVLNNFYGTFALIRNKYVPYVPNLFMRNYCHTHHSLIDVKNYFFFQESGNGKSFRNTGVQSEKRLESSSESHQKIGEWY